MSRNSSDKSWIKILISIVIILLLIFLVFKLFSRSAQFSPESLQQGLVAHWTFDEVSGNLQTTFLDSGTGNQGGTLFGNVVRVPGKSGSALKFDGSPTSYAKVSLLHPYSDTPRYSISMWLKPEEVGRRQLFFSYGGSSAPNTACQQYMSMNGDGQFYYSHGNATAYVQSNFVGSTRAVNGTWINLIVTYDGSAIKTYTNGVLIKTTATAVPFSSVGDTYLGGTCGYPWYGAIDEVRIYNRVLSDAEITELSNVAGALVNFDPVIPGNLLGNSFFEQDLRVGNSPANGNWGLFSGSANTNDVATIAVSSDPNNRYHKFVQVSGYSYALQEVNLFAGKTYNLSYVISSNAGTKAAVIVQNQSWTGFAGVYPNTSIGLSGKELSLVFTVPRDGTYKISVGTVPDNANTANMAWFDEVVLVDVSTVTPPPSLCTDSDGGNNINVKGITQGMRQAQLQNFTDSCFNSMSINEGYCNGDMLITSNYSCSSGTICSDGACALGDVAGNLIGNGHFQNPIRADNSGVNGNWRLDATMNAGSNGISILENGGNKFLAIVGSGFATQEVDLAARGLFADVVYNLSSLVSADVGAHPILIIQNGSWAGISAVYPNASRGILNTSYSFTFSVPRSGLYRVSLAADPISANNGLSSQFDEVVLKEVNTTADNPNPNPQDLRGLCVPFVANGNPIPAKTRVQNVSITPGGNTVASIYYCDPASLSYLRVKNNAQSCLSDYECNSNACIDGQCTSVRVELGQQTSLLKKIFCFITNPFNHDNYLSCIAVTRCGDGQLNQPNSAGVNEVCDDGNTANGDSCASDCLSGTGN